MNFRFRDFGGLSEASRFSLRFGRLGKLCDAAVWEVHKPSLQQEATHNNNNSKNNANNYSNTNVNLKNSTVRYFFSTNNNNNDNDNIKS